MLWCFNLFGMFDIEFDIDSCYNWLLMWELKIWNLREFYRINVYCKCFVIF